MPFESKASRHESITLLRVAYLLLVKGLLASLVALDAEHRWHLSPAYDLTPCTGINGEHCSTVNGKGKDITDADRIKAASVGGVGVRKVKEMIEQVAEALRTSSKPY